MTSEVPVPTFRDPAGSLSFQDDLAIRRIDAAARVHVLQFIESPFCRKLQKRGDLIGASVDDSTDGLCLIHPRIQIPTYPWEWTPSQWLAAGTLTLNLCREALSEGWILKDATPLNVLFTGARPIFVDILSFERLEPGGSIWLAYGQYIRTFLLPLLMNRLLGWPLSLSLFKRDGYEPSDCYAALSWGHRLSTRALWPITLPTLLERRKDAGTTQKRKPDSIHDPEIAVAVLTRTLDKLRKHTHRAVASTGSSDWSNYQTTLTHYTSEESRRKMEWVQGVIDTAAPAHVLDIGANTGEFSALAAGRGAQVVALERDMAAADRLFRMAREQNLAIQTIHADIARPTPAVGWQNAESVALLSRLEGQSDLVLMLAVIHHLILMEQIPLPAIVDLCHRLTRHHLVIEWVPVEDPMYQSLMRGRDSLYGSLSEKDLLNACNGLFRTTSRQHLDNGRVLFLFEKVG